MTDLAISDRAFELHQELVGLTLSATHHFFRMGELMKEIRDDELWRIMGYESFEAYFSDPELDFKKSSVYHAINLVETFRERKELETIPVSKLIMVAPHITESNKSEMVEMARTLSRSDLQHQLIVMKLATVAPQLPPFPKVYPCMRCGKVRGITVKDLCTCSEVKI